MNDNLIHEIGEWVDKGNVINGTLREKLKNKAMGIDHSVDFDKTYYVAYNNIPRSELEHLYLVLSEASRNISEREERSILDMYVASGTILFVNAENSPYYDEIKAFVSNRIKCPDGLPPKTETVSQEGHETKSESASNAEANNNNTDAETQRRKDRSKEERDRKKREAERQAEIDRQNEKEYIEKSKEKQRGRRKSNQNKENRRQRKRSASKLGKILFTVGILFFLLIESDLVWMLKSELKSRSGDKNEEVVTMLEEAPEEDLTQAKVKKKEKKQSKEIVQKDIHNERTSEKNKRDNYLENKQEEHQINEEKNSSSQETKTSENQSELNDILKELHKQFSKDNGKSRFETNVEYGIEKGISDVNDLLRRAESLNPQNKEVVSYRKQYNSIMQKHDLL